MTGILDEDYTFLHGYRGLGEYADLRAPVLVVLDPMSLFCAPHSPAFLPSWPDVQKNIEALVHAFAFACRPVLATRHCHDNDDDGALLQRFFGRLQNADDELTNILPNLQTLIPSANVVSKSRHSAFSAPEFGVRCAGCDALVIVGVQSNLCVLATALDAARYKMVPIVVADACCARKDEDHRAALRVLASGHAHITSSDLVQRFLRHNCA